jgi:DNA repair protein RadD
MLHLRPYQEAAKAALYEHLRARADNPCVVIPTAGGKTPVIATVCKDAVGLWQGRVLILAHVKELLEQAADKLRAVCPEVPFGLYSASLRRREKDHPVIIAGIQSVFRRACELGPFDLIVVDKAHLIPPEGDGMYRQFLADAKVVNPQARVVGFTATPFRLKTGTICTPDGILNTVCYEVGVRELMRDGYLCPLVTRAGKTKVETAGLHVRGGDFVAGEVEALMEQDALVRAACAEIVARTHDRHACLIFAAGVGHGEHVVRMLAEDHGLECGFVTGGTPAAERDGLLKRFREGGLKYLCNVSVLTTGFDAPNIDCVALLRPTLSPGLYYQMVGRGFRLHPGKRDCLVLDFGGNVLRHGPVDQVRAKEQGPGEGGEAPVKECPECHALIAAGYARCPDCGHAFPPPERPKHDATASEAGILSGQVTTATYPVRDVRYRVHTKRGAGPDAPRMLRVDYEVGWQQDQSEWVCFEHSGYARQKAEAWWRRRSTAPVPDTAQQALAIAAAGGLAPVTSITIRSVAGEPYERIIDHEVGQPPPGADLDEVHAGPVDTDLVAAAEDAIPF